MNNKKVVIICIVLIIALIGGSAGLIYINQSKETSAVSEDSLTESQGDDKKQKDADPQEDPENEADRAEEATSIIFTGDVLLSNYVLSNYNSKGMDGVLSADLQETLNQSDITMINNEFPYSTRGSQAPDKQYTFRVDPSYVSVIQQMGVDIAGLANNHVLDYGTEALEDTFTTLDNAGIEYTGAGDSLEDASKLIIREVNGKTYGFLAASRVIPVGSWNVENATPGVFTTYDPTKLIAAIQEAKSTCDYVYVSVHWGTEHTDVLTDYQAAMAHKFIDAGADAVIGSHPHVLQGMEYYNEKPIFYSLGNFIFNQSIERTVAVEITVDAKGTSQVRLIPASAQNAYTHTGTGTTAQSIYDYLMSISPSVTIDNNGYMTMK